MKKKFVLFYVLTWFCNIFPANALTINELVDLINNKKLETIKLELKSLVEKGAYYQNKSVNKAGDLLIGERYIETLIDFDLYKINCTIEEFTGDKDYLKKYKEFELHLLYSQNELIYAHLFHSKEKILKYIDEHKLKDFVSKFNQFYKSKYSINPEQIPFFYEIEDGVSDYTYGLACSVSGSPPYYMTGLRSQLKKRSPSLFLDWIKSFIPELQAYGVTGLYYLAAKRQYIIPPDVQVIINHIKNKESSVGICEGCSFYPKNLSLLLTEKELNKFISYID